MRSKLQYQLHHAPRLQRHHVHRGIVGIYVASILGALASMPSIVRAQGLSSSYSGYTVRMCSAVVERLFRFVYRGTIDTTEYTPAKDTLPGVIRDAARNCIASLAFDTVNVKDMRRLAVVYLMADDDSSARSAFDRYLEIALTPQDRAERLVDVIGTLVRGRQSTGQDAFPPRPSLALHYLALLDQLTGPRMAEMQRAGHKTMLGYYVETSAPFAQVLSEWKTSTRLLSQYSDAQQKHKEQREDAFLLLRLALQEERRGGPLAKTIIDTVAAELRAIGDTTFLARVTSVLEQFAFGQPAPQLTADYVVGELSGPSLPRPGRVTYVMWDLDREQAAIVRRIKAKVQDSVDFVLVRGLSTTFHQQGPFTPEQEVDSLRHFYLEELKFPGTLVLSVLPSQQTPDKRYLLGPNPNQVAYMKFIPGLPVLIDRGGKVQASVALPWLKTVEQDILNDIRAMYNPSMWQF